MVLDVTDCYCITSVQTAVLFFDVTDCYMHICLDWNMFSDVTDCYCISVWTGIWM